MKGMSFAVVLLSATLAGLVISSYSDFRNAVYADDNTKPSDEATPKEQTPYQQMDALYDEGILGRHSTFVLNYHRLKSRVRTGSDDAKLLESVGRRYDEARERRMNLLMLSINETALLDPANVARFNEDLAKLKSDIAACEKDYWVLLVQYFPSSTVIEPLMLEFRKACGWNGGRYRDDDLRTMYAFADMSTVYTEDEKKELDDLGMRYERGSALESALWKLFQTDGAMDRSANVEKARRLLAEFKKATAGWDATRRRLWHKVFDMTAIAEHEQRLKDAAKTLESADEEAREATPPK